jgi:hypothetical protein
VHDPAGAAAAVRVAENIAQAVRHPSLLGGFDA